MAKKKILDTSGMPGINRRVYELIEKYSDGNVSNFAKDIGVIQQTLDRLFKPDVRNKEGKYPSVPETVKKGIYEKFNINDIWLLTGKGEMLLNKEEIEYSDIQENNPQFINDKNDTDMKDYHRLLLDQIMDLTRKNTLLEQENEELRNALNLKGKGIS